MLATWRYTAQAIIHSYAHRSSSFLKNYLQWLMFKPKLGKTNANNPPLGGAERFINNADILLVVFMSFDAPHQLL